MLDRSYWPAATSIAVWYFANVSTVILNKYIYTFIGFNFPLSLTAVHMLVATLGAWIVQTFPVFGIPAQFVDNNYFVRRLIPISFLFCFNIILGNISLRFIHVSFMQTIKSAVPACTVFFQAVVLRDKIPRIIYLTLIPIVGGVMLATQTEANFNAIGFWTAVAASFVTAGSAILNGMVLTTKLNPIALLYYTAPPSLIMLLPLVFLYEYDRLVAHFASDYDPRTIPVLIISGLIALLLNASSFWVIQKTSPLTFTVAGNFKVVISVVISVFIFQNEIGIFNAMGCAAAVAGVAWYNQIRFNINREEQLKRDASNVANKV